MSLSSVFVNRFVKIRPFPAVLRLFPGVFLFLSVNTVERVKEHFSDFRSLVFLHLRKLSRRFRKVALFDCLPDSFNNSVKKVNDFLKNAFLFRFAVASAIFITSYQKINFKTLDRYALRAYNINVRRLDMKQRDLVKLFEKNGWTFYRNGGSHDIYIKGKNSESIPRHKEVNEKLAKSLIKRWGLK